MVLLDIVQEFVEVATIFCSSHQHRLQVAHQIFAIELLAQDLDVSYDLVVESMEETVRFPRRLVHQGEEVLIRIGFHC